MALARADHVRFSYPGVSGAALDDVSLEIDAGEVVLLLGRSGCGKTTLLRAFSGLIPHFHGGRFAGRVIVGGLDTRRSRPADLVGVVATLFQDPEDQVVFDRVAAEVSFGLENAGVQALEIEGHVRSALAAVGAGHLAGRRIAELSGGEVQRVCLASTLALNPSLLLLDEPTSQLDPAAADGLLRLVRRLARERGTAVLLSEQRVSRALAMADRVVVMDEGAVVFDGSRSAAGAWLATDRPSYLSLARERANGAPGEIVCILDGVAFAYSDGRPVFEQIRLELRRGEIVALTGPNGVGKTTLGKLAAGLLEPTAGTVECRGRCAYLLQDPGRHLVRERCDEEVALGATSLPKAMRALGEVGLAGYEERHPRDLSSGERERLALAAVLATDPDVLVLDEPTRGIDPDAKQGLAALLRARAHGRATLVASHDPDFLRAVADRTVSLPEARRARAA